MTTATAFLSALQLADSSLPVGRFVHSAGLESWLKGRKTVAPEQLGELIEAVICQGVAPLDGVVLGHAWAAGSLSELRGLDARLTARKLTPAARSASHDCGRQLAALAPALAPRDALVTTFADSVACRATDGNYVVVAGTLSRACGLSARDAVLVELRSAASGFLSAAVRLGAITPTGAQRVLTSLHEPLELAAGEAGRRSLDELHSSVPELETHSLTHRRADVRFFRT